jgi:hypothetical protein
LKNIKWVFLLMLGLFSMSCASVEPKLFQNTLADNPNITPQQLQATLKSNPIIYNNIRSISYQVYKVCFFNTQTAVYFKNGQMVTQAPYDPYANLKMLLQLGAISQAEYDKKSYCVGDSCTCLVPIDCNGVCGGPAVPDACGVCGGNVSSCSSGYSCVGDSCVCTSGTDCNGTCGGSATVDCSGTCGGSATTDICGVCNGNGTSCIPQPST